MPLPLIIGEAPSKSGDPFHDFPLSGAVGMRLAKLAGIMPTTGGSQYGRWYWPLTRSFDLHNLLERYPGPLGRGADLPMHLAEPAARALRPQLAGRVVVLLGSRLPRAFELPGDPFEWYVGAPFAYAVIPHPSGLNRAWDNPNVERRAGEVLRRALDLATPVPVSE